MPQDLGCKSLRELTEATATFISYRLHVLTEASAPFLPSTNRSVRLVYTQFVGWARMKSYLDCILSRCTQDSFVFRLKHGRPMAMPAFAPNGFNPLVGFLRNSLSALI
jgi:hypothetical protein